MNLSVYCPDGYKNQCTYGSRLFKDQNQTSPEQTVDHSIGRKVRCHMGTDRDSDQSFHSESVRLTVRNWNINYKCGKIRKLLHYLDIQEQNV